MNNKFPFSLFIFDLDGTVLGGHEPYKQFPPEFAGFLDELDSYEVKWGTATTWEVDKQLKLIRGSGVKSDPVMLTGSTRRQAVAVVDDMLIRFPEYDMETEKLDRVLVAEYGELIMATIDKMKSKNLVQTISYNSCKHHVISFNTAKGKEVALWETLSPLLEKNIYYPFRSGISGENMLLPIYMNKARAVRHIQKIANISSGKTLIAGDEQNDIHMFDTSLAKYMICPANAHMEIKNWVRKNNGFVASKNYSYGIIEAVNKLLSE